jgi:hypothetical protein
MLQKSQKEEIGRELNTPGEVKVLIAHKLNASICVSCVHYRATRPHVLAETGNLQITCDKHGLTNAVSTCRDYSRVAEMRKRA